MEMNYYCILFCITYSVEPQGQIPGNIENCRKKKKKKHEILVLNFEKNEVVVPELSISELSTDQNYNFQISEDKQHFI